MTGALGFDPQACRDVGQYVHEDLANTLTVGTNPGWHNGVAYGVAKATGFDRYNQCLTGDICATLRTPDGGDNRACVIECRAEAHGNVPAVVCYDARGNGDGQTVSTITGDHENRITDYTSVVVEQEPVCYNGENITSPLNKTDPQPGDPCHTLGTDSRNWLVQPVYCIDGDKIGKAERSGGSGLGIRDGDKMYTLTAKDAGTHAVAYSIGNGQLNQISMSETCNTLYEPQVYTDGTVPTLVAKGPSAVAVRYIVRRLTPTECARLQGFPDKWGHPDHKDSLTDEEWTFWSGVRNTHAAINGKPVKNYTREQMLAWYNKLHTDSAEYKMWGNGIALPCALYVMEGIVDALKEEIKWTL